jgi:cytochrome c-type biogenesis protein CcmE
MTRFYVACFVIVVMLGVLVYSAIDESKREVVTVDAISSQADRDGVQLGARVADNSIEYTTSPSFLLRFNVRDITGSENVIPVVYEGIMPDTLKSGRDVILEGNWRGGVFQASKLLTQCPSKYEPPVAGETAKQS